MPGPAPRPQRRSRLPGRAAVERHPRLDHRCRRAPVPQQPGAGAILCFMGHALMENRTGLIVQAELAWACGAWPLGP
jgi:hypothetical protein